MACTSQVYDSLDTCEGEHVTRATLEESLHIGKDNCKKPATFFLLVKKKEKLSKTTLLVQCLNCFLTQPDSFCAMPTRIIPGSPIGFLEHD